MIFDAAYYDRKRAALEETVARMNAERAAIGLPPDCRVGFTAQGVPYLAVTDAAPTKAPRVRPPPPVAKPARVRPPPKETPHA